MDLGLNDRVAIVAAASNGLGKAVALGLAKSVSNELSKDGITVNSVCPSTEASTKRCSNLVGGGRVSGDGDGSADADVGRDPNFADFARYSRPAAGRLK